MLGSAPIARASGPGLPDNSVGCRNRGMRRECSMLGLPATQPHHTAYPDSGFRTDL